MLFCRAITILVVFSLMTGLDTCTKFMIFLYQRFISVSLKQYSFESNFVMFVSSHLTQRTCTILKPKEEKEISCVFTNRTEADDKKIVEESLARISKSSPKEEKRDSSKTELNGDQSLSKDLKKLNKKLEQIEKLKNKQAAGEKLEVTQVRLNYFVVVGVCQDLTL